MLTVIYLTFLNITNNRYYFEYSNILLITRNRNKYTRNKLEIEII